MGARSLIGARWWHQPAPLGEPCDIFIDVSRYYGPSVFGLLIKLDPAMPPDQAVFLDEHGREVGRIVNVGYKP